MTVNVAFFALTMKSASSSTRRNLSSSLTPVRSTQTTSSKWDGLQKPPVSAYHQHALVTSLSFVHTARRYYRLNGSVRPPDCHSESVASGACCLMLWPVSAGPSCAVLRYGTYLVGENGPPMAPRSRPRPPMGLNAFWPGAERESCMKKALRLGTKAGSESRFFLYSSWLEEVGNDHFEPGAVQTRSFRGSKSRNKVSVREPAEGSLTGCVRRASARAAGQIAMSCSALSILWRRRIILPGTHASIPVGTPLVLRAVCNGVVSGVITECSPLRTATWGTQWGQSNRSLVA